MIEIQFLVSHISANNNPLKILHLDPQHFNVSEQFVTHTHTDTHTHTHKRILRNTKNKPEFFSKVSNNFSL